MLCLAICKRRPNRANPTGVIAGWKNILNVLSFQPSTKARPLAFWSRPRRSCRWMAWRPMIPNRASTRLSQDP